MIIGNPDIGVIPALIGDDVGQLKFGIRADFIGCAVGIISDAAVAFSGGIPQSDAAARQAHMAVILAGFVRAEKRERTVPMVFAGVDMRCQVAGGLLAAQSLTQPTVFNERRFIRLGGGGCTQQDKRQKQPEAFFQNGDPF